MNQAGQSIAGNLRRLRDERGISLETLAAMTGVSKSMLRQIEIGQSSPTINTLWKIANGLRIPFTALLNQESRSVTTGTFTENSPLQTENPGYRLYPLLTFDPTRAFEVYYVEIDPGAHLDAEPHQGHAEEQLFLIKGELEITIMEEVYNLSSDSFLRFQADCHHGYHNKGTALAAALILLSYLP